MQDLLERCRQLTAAPDLRTLGRWLTEAQVDLSAERPDPSRPYGRHVLLETRFVEAMVATWTPGSWCAPHDHGGSVGGVRVLRGQAAHRVYRRSAGRLEAVRDEVVRRGEVMRCGPDLVHAMADGGGDEPLMTLHLYAGPIDHMVVYDLDNDETLVVDGGCGAWVPERADLVRSRRPGLH